jgi:hypothetical protein
LVIASFKPNAAIVESSVAKLKYKKYVPISAGGKCLLRNEIWANAARADKTNPPPADTNPEVRCFVRVLLLYSFIGNNTAIILECGAIVVWRVEEKPLEVVVGYPILVS